MKLLIKDDANGRDFLDNGRPMIPEEMFKLHERLGDEYIARCHAVGLKDFPEVAWMTSPDGRQTCAIVLLENEERTITGPIAMLPSLAFDLAMESRRETN